jgi:hypothetical protein
MTAITASPVSVDFHGTTIPTFNVGGIIRVAMKPICDGIGLQWEAQHKRIKRHPVLAATMSMMDMVARDGKRRQLLTLPLNKLNGWLFGIDTNRVKPEIRERLVEYQAECFDVLSDYWQKGEAVNPRATTIDERRPLNRAVRTLANLRSARGEAADYASVWKLVNGYLGVKHIEQATQPQIDRAMAFVQDSIEAEATQAIEGHYLGQQTEAPKDELNLDYPLERWLEINPGLRQDGLNRGRADHFMVMEYHLYGESAGSPTMLMLNELRLAGHNVDACMKELQALRHYLEVNVNRVSAIRYAADKTSSAMRMPLAG